MTDIHLRADEWDRLENGQSITVCIASDNPDEKYHCVDIHPPSVR